MGDMLFLLFVNKVDVNLKRRPPSCQDKKHVFYVSRILSGKVAVSKDYRILCISSCQFRDVKNEISDQFLISLKKGLY